MTDVVSPNKDTDTTVLLSMLNTEVERLKGQESLQKEENRSLDRDAKRTTIMLTLAQEQIELHKERNIKLKHELDDERDSSSRLRTRVEKLERDLKSSEDDTVAATKRGEKAEGKLAAELEGKKVEVTQLDGTVERLRKELEETKVSFSKQVDAASKAEREAFQTQLNLKTRVQSLETELEDLEQLRSRETREVTAREYELSKSVQDLKNENRALKDQVERENRAAFEVQTLLRSENEQVKLKLAQLEGMTKVSDRENFDKIQKLTSELRDTKERFEDANSAAIAREKALDMQIAKLCTDLRVAQQEINQLADKEAAGAKNHIDTIVQLSATRDSLRARVSSLEDDVATQKEKNRAAEVAFAQEREEMKRRLQVISHGHNTTVASKSDEISKVTHELTTTTYRMTALEEDLRTTKKAAEQNDRIHAAEIGSLKAEIEGYKKSVEMLERDRNDNITILTLKEQNETLKNQCTQLRNQITHANKSLADLRVEADISESYRITQMQEHVESQLNRVSSLEKERRFARPLLQDLVDLVQRKDIVDPALARDIDLFFRQFGNSPDAPAVK